MGNVTNRVDGAHPRLTRTALCKLRAPSVEHPRSSRSADSMTQSAIHKAIQECNMDQVSSLLYSQTNVVNATDDKGTTPLHLAVELGNVKVVCKLLHHGADVNKKDLCMMTPLHVAAGGGKMDIVKIFLTWETGVSWNERDIWGWTPLHRSIINHHFDMALMLLNRGCLVNVPDENRRVAIHVAGSYGHLELTKTLLDCGAAINWQDARGRTALYLAVVGKHAEVVTELIHRGCNMNLSTINRVTPLGLAAQKGHLDCVQALIQAGAKCCNQRLNNSDTIPLESALLRASNQQAKKYDSFRNIVEMLIQADGGSPSSQSFFIALHALQVAPSSDMLRIIQLLLCAGVQPSVPPSLILQHPTEEQVNSWVGYYLRSCQSLKDLCRTSIRTQLHHVHQNVVFAVSRLTDFPTLLKDIILLKHL